MKYVSYEQLESLQNYHFLYKRVHKIMEAPAVRCGYCCEAEVEEDGDVCRQCKADLAELNS